MITNIQLNPSQQAQLKGTDLQQLRNLAAAQFPYPLAVSFRNFHDTIAKGDKTLALIVFANDVTTSVFQFLSLMLASEYIESSAPRTLRLYQTIENMTYRPGPGKWLAFLREFYLHQKENPDTLGNFPEILDFIERNEIKKKSFSLLIEENNGSSPSKKLGLLELMVNLRNNFAHSKGYDKATLDNITAAVGQIVDLLLSELAFLDHYKLLLSPPDGKDAVALMGTELPDISKIPIESLLMVMKEEFRVKLFPMFINDKTSKGKTQDIFLLESLDNKKIFYASNRQISEKSIDKDQLALQLTEALKSIFVEPDILDASKISFDQFYKRVLQYTEQALSEYELNGKYGEDVYVLPREYDEIIKSFYASDKKIIFLRDDQGSGKSAFCAYLANLFAKDTNPSRINFLLDARLLDEMEEAPMLFDDYIKKKLGIKGDLHLFLKALQGNHPDIKLILTIDNLNEYFLKGVDQAFLMERLFDFMHRLKDIINLQIIAIARPEYFKKSIEKYGQQFRDKKIDEITFMPQANDKGEPLITTLLPPLSREDLGQIWRNYASHLTGYSPKTPWEELSTVIKDHCRKPLIMLYILKQYDNMVIPEELSIKDIKKQYVDGILKNKTLKDTLFDLVKQMNKAQRPYLLTETMDSDQLRIIIDSSKNSKTGISANHAYIALTDMHLIREEKVMKEQLMGKKISVNNEMTMDIILEKFKKEEKKKSMRFNIFILLIMALVIYSLIFSNYSTFLQYSQSISLPVFNGMFNQIFTPDLNVNGKIIPIMADIFYANYSIKSMFDQLFIPAIVIISIIMVLFAIFLFIHDKAAKENFILRNFNTYEVFHFKSIGSIITRKLTRFLLILFGIGIIIPFLLLINNPESDQLNTFFILSLVIIGLALLVFMAMLFYKTILGERNIYVDYLRKSFSGFAKYSIIVFYVFSLGLFAIFYFSDTLINHSQKRVHDTYILKFEQKIREIQSLATQSEIETLIQRIEGQYCSDTENPVCMLLEDIVSGLNDEEIHLSYVSEANEILSTFTQSFKELTKYWYFFVFGPAILMLIMYSTIEVPIFFAKRKLHEEVGLAIA